MIKKPDQARFLPATPLSANLIARQKLYFLLAQLFIFVP